MKVSEYQAVSNLSVHSDTTELLTDTEKALRKSFTRFEIQGKGGRPVPVLLTNEMKKCVDILISTREKANINPKNPYLFAVAKTAQSCIRGSDVLRKYGRLCGAKMPQNIKSILLRKHVATMSQLLNLSGSDVESLATFMGHSVDVHKEYYRLPDNVAQMAKISKLLLALESNKIKELKDQNFDSIPVSDCESEINEEVVQDISATNKSSRASTSFDSQEKLSQTLNSEILKRRPEGSSSVLNDCNTSEDSSRLSNSHANVVVIKKRRAASVRNPWSAVETEAIVKHLKKHIICRKVPNQEECLKCINAETCLSKRSWSHVKFQVKNMFGKL